MSRLDRTQLVVTVVPDPILRETLEALGFFRMPDIRRWARVADGENLSALEKYLSQRSIPFEKKPAGGGGVLQRWPKLSEELVVEGGGDDQRCGVCGKWADRCHLYRECDDSDSPEYEEAAEFHVCPACIKAVIDPHPRLYVRLN